MKEVIAEILEEERKGRERVANARDQAKRIREAAEKESKQVLSESKTTLRKEAEAIIARSESEAQREKEKELKATEGAGQKLRENKKREIEKAVDSLFKKVLSGDSR